MPTESGLRTSILAYVQANPTAGLGVAVRDLLAHERAHGAEPLELYAALTDMLCDGVLEWVPVGRVRLAPREGDDVTTA